MATDVKDISKLELRGTHFDVIFKRGDRQEGRIGVNRAKLIGLLVGEQFDEAIIVPESSKIGNNRFKYQIVKYHLAVGGQA